MNENNSRNTSLTDWDRVDALTDEEIDTSDIPPLDEDFFANAELKLPQPKNVTSIRLGYGGEHETMAPFIGFGSFIG